LFKIKGFLQQLQPKQGRPEAAPAWAVTAICLLLSLWYFGIQPKSWFHQNYATLLLDNQGKVLGATLNSNQQYQFQGSDSIPTIVHTCVLTYEDRHFYSHFGVNPLSLVNAITTYIQGGKLRGGSTITMQTVRLATGNRAPNIWRKIKEIVFAIRLELDYSKKEILSQYLNLAPYGGNIVGIQAAARRYFGKPPKELSWAQAAMLSVLPNDPARLYPGKNNQKLLEKRNRLLKQLLAEGHIDKPTYASAILEPIPTGLVEFPHIATHLLITDRNQHPEGNTIYSTLNARLQSLSGRIAEQYAHNQQTTNNINNLAIIIAETETGKIIAYHGNAPGPNTPNWHVDAGQAQRSYGSLLKPFLYAAALDEGLIMPQSWLEDVPKTYASYSPKNFYNTYEGFVKADIALSHSLNTCFVNLLAEYGSHRFYRLMNNYGLNLRKPANHYGLSVILGGAESNLWQLCSMYRNMGKLALGSNTCLLTNEQVPIFYEKADTINRSDNQQLMSRKAAWLTLKAMVNAQRPDLNENYIRFATQRKIAWKTGTSFGLRDAWAIGVTPKYTIGVWLGNATGEGRAGLTGTNTAAPLLFQLFELLPAENQWFPSPTYDLEKTCAITGRRAGPFCDSTQESPCMPAKTNKTTLCYWHQPILVDNDNQYRVNYSCWAAEQTQKRNGLILDGAAGWFYLQGKSKIPPFIFNHIYPWHPACVSEANQPEILYPTPNLVISPIRKKAEAAVGFYAKAMQPNGAGELFWQLDGEFLAISKGRAQVFIPILNNGTYKHDVTIVNADGVSKSVTFYTQ